MLTMTAIQGKKPCARQYEISERTGLRVRIYPSGRKTFIWRYRGPLGHQKVLTLGKVRKKGDSNGLTLKEARVRLNEAQADREHGLDPAEKKAAENQAQVEAFRERAAAPTVEDLLQEYLTRHIDKNRSPRTAREFRRLIETNLTPICGGLKAADLTRPTLIATLDRIADEATPSVADHAAVVIRGALNYAVKRGRLESSPAQDLPRYARKRGRERVLHPHEIKALWQALERSDGVSRPVSLAIKLLLLTGQRRRSLAVAKWEEFTDQAWEIPAGHTKTGQPNWIPLSSLAKETLGELRTETGESEWLLPNPKLDGPIRPGALTHALGRICKELKGNRFTLHDLRRTAATLMAEAGVPRVVIGRVLGHKDSSVTAIYDRHEYATEKKRALEAISRKIRRIIGKPQSAEVVNLR